MPYTWYIWNTGKLKQLLATFPLPIRVLICLKIFKEGRFESTTEKLLADFCGFTNHKSPSYAKHFRALKNVEGFIETFNDGGIQVRLTQKGVDEIQPANATDNKTLHDRIKALLKELKGRGDDIFDAILEHQAVGGIGLQELGASLGFTNWKSPSFVGPLRDLKKAGFVTTAGTKETDVRFVLTDKAFVNDDGEVDVNGAVV